MTRWLKPPALPDGGTIGVVAPASGIRDARMERGMACLRGRGYRVVEGRHLYDRHGFLAGTDHDRAADLNAMFADPAIDAIFCGRGGYGSVRLIDLIDWDTVRAHPKVFAGYSDITALQLAMESHAGLVTFHGAMVCTHGEELADHAADGFWRQITRPEPLGLVATGGAAIRTLVGGSARGRLVGGNLTLLCAALGTPEQPGFDGRIVLFEDVGEQAYRIDRMLVQLRRAGLLEQAAGFVIGTATDWDKGLTAPPPITLDDVWRTQLAPLGVPIVLDYPFGHIDHPVTLPIGCEAELDAGKGRLTLLEPAVS